MPANPLILRPDGAGFLTVLSLFGAGTNHGAVNETTPDGDTSYVFNDQTDAAGFVGQDLYTLENPPASLLAGAHIIDSVRLHHRSRFVTNNGRTDVQPLLRIASTIYSGTNVAVTGAYVTYSTTWALNPRTAAAWQWSELSALQAGPRHDVAGGGPGLPSQTRTTTFWAAVHWTPRPTFPRQWFQFNVRDFAPSLGSAIDPQICDFSGAVADVVNSTGATWEAVSGTGATVDMLSRDGKTTDSVSGQGATTDALSMEGKTK